MIPVESVICWKWQPAPGYRSTFGPEAVNILRRMVARHYDHPHRFVCCTDDPRGIDPAVEIVPLWRDHATLLSPHGPGKPSCYRRLRAFSDEAATWFGRRFVSLDLDCVIVGDLTPLWDRPEEFVIWTGQNSTTPYNSSMYVLTAAARRQVWDTFDPRTSPARTAAAGFYGSDQAWLCACLGPREATWTKADGVYSFRNDLKFKTSSLPANARIVMFHGHRDPWDDPMCRELAWVREHYR